MSDLKRVYGTNQPMMKDIILMTSDIWHAAMDVYPSGKNGVPSPDASKLAKELERELKKQGWKKKQRMWYYPTHWTVKGSMISPISSDAKKRGAHGIIPKMNDIERAELFGWARAIAGLPDNPTAGLN